MLASVQEIVHTSIVWRRSRRVRQHCGSLPTPRRRLGGLGEHGRGSDSPREDIEGDPLGAKTLLRVHTCHNTMPIAHLVRIRIAGW